MPLMTVVMDRDYAYYSVDICRILYFSQIANMVAFMQYALQVIISFMVISMIFLVLPRARVSINRISEGAKYSHIH